MSGAASDVTANYGSGRVLERVLALLTAEGIDPERPTHEELKRFDSLHIGGWRATEELLDGLGIVPGTRALDVGCGLGATARTLAARHGAVVEGLDLTPEFVEVARELTRRTGVADVAFTLGDGAELPFDDASFDLATMLHVGMNVADKAGLFAEVARVLRPGGTFAVYDAMRVGPGDPTYPLPWAGTEAISFLETADAYAHHAAGAGLAERTRRSRVAEGIERLKTFGPISVARGMPTERLANVLAALETGMIAPVEMIFVKLSREGDA
jgi:ubiquinone/menaquinone biosynthesis C-methylase UbiE